MKWFVGAALLLAAALLLESGLLAYAMYVLLALLVVSRLLALSWIGSLVATRKCSDDEVEVGETITVNLTVENKSKLPVPWILLEDLIPAKMTIAEGKKLLVKKRRLKIASIAPGGKLKLDYKIQFRSRGYYQIGPLVLETGDFFGLHRRYHVGAEPSYVLVYPELVPLEGYELASRRPIGEIRMAHRLYEDPTRIAGVRQYEAGDPLSRVHWRATARTGELHCKIYEPSTIAGATIVIDLFEGGYPSRLEPERSELAVSAAASFAYAVYQMGQQIGLLANGRDAIDRIRQEGYEGDYRTRKAAMQGVEPVPEEERRRPIKIRTDRGVEQFERIWATLARTEMNDGLTFAELLMETSGDMPRDATVIVILPRVTAEDALVLGDLRRRGYAVTAVLVMFEDGEERIAHGKLLAEGVEVRHIKDRETLTTACQRQVFR
ncbi:MAG: DUF58 domain-containing protein [Gemmataceae bacterium]